MWMPPRLATTFGIAVATTVPPLLYLIHQ